MVVIVLCISSRLMPLYLHLLETELRELTLPSATQHCAAPFDNPCSFLQNSRENNISGSLQDTIQSFCFSFAFQRWIWGMSICTGGLLGLSQSFFLRLFTFQPPQLFHGAVQAVLGKFKAQILLFAKSICALDSYTHLQNFVFNFITFWK